MRSLISVALAATVLSLCAGGANAESFTFINSNAGTPDQVMLAPADPAGRSSGATVYGTHTAAIFADGAKSETNARCANWVLPPDSQFGQTGVCEYKDANGPLYESRFTCAVAAKGATGIDCWGTLAGTGGVWKGRTGAFTLRTLPTGAQGQGHWN